MWTRRRHHTIVYGDMKCPWTRKQIEYLDNRGMSYNFYDCAKKRCPMWVKGFPTLKTSDGKIHSGFTRI